MPRRRLVRGLVFPLLANAGLAQIIVTLARIAISYRAAELSLSPSQVLILSASFSVLPAALAIGMGRYNDGHGNGMAALVGTGLMVAACAAILAPGMSAWHLLLASIALGLGQTFQLTGLQGEVGLLRRTRHRERMVGGLMVWQAIGQVSAPVFLSAMALSQGQISAKLAAVSTLIALISFALSASLWRNATKPQLKGAQPGGLRRLLVSPHLVWVMIAGSLCVAVHDLMLIYLPVIGPTRDIPPSQIGLLLALSAGGQTASRALYGLAVEKVGPRRLMSVGILGTAIPTAMLALPVGVVWIAIFLALSGLAMGLAISSSLLLTMSMAPVEARATGLGLRLAVNRIGQFVIPVASGAAAATLGPDAVFMVVGMLLAAVGAYGVWLLQGR